jgi:uncharacterized protein (DUF2267 family)
MESIHTVPADGAAARFFQEIALTGALPRQVSPHDAASAVLCTISRRVSGDQAQDFVGSLSQNVRLLLAPCVIHRDEQSETFGREGFLARVSDHLRCSPEEAEAIARAVFSALHKHMSTKEVDEVENQLPADLKPLWRG